MADWERSGLGCEAFAASRRLNGRTLTWWRWRLRHPVGGEPAADELRLVRVDVEPDVAHEARSDTATKASWEIATPRGVLRVHEGIADAALDAVLAALVDKGAS